MVSGSDRARDRAANAYKKSVYRAKKKLMDMTILNEARLEEKLIELSSQNRICNSKGFFKINHIADIINENP